jgi:hypothetical protein
MLKGSEVVLCLPGFVCQDFWRLTLRALWILDTGVKVCCSGLPAVLTASMRAALCSTKWDVAPWIVVMQEDLLHRAVLFEMRFQGIAWHLLAEVEKGNFIACWWPRQIDCCCLHSMGSASAVGSTVAIDARR